MDQSVKFANFSFLTYIALILVTYINNSFFFVSLGGPVSLDRPSLISTPLYILILIIRVKAKFYIGT